MEHQKSITCTLLSGLLVILILISPLCCLPDSIKPPLLPMPHAVSWKTGRYCLPDLVHVHIKGEVENADRQMLSLLLKDWNVTQVIFDNFKNKNITIVCDHQLVLPSASLEAYRIDVDEQGIQIEARTSAGVFYALKTLGQVALLLHYRLSFLSLARLLGRRRTKFSVNGCAKRADRCHGAL